MAEVFEDHTIDHYWCFVSYRHADNEKQDRDWASWIHQEIERYEVPADLVGTTNARGDTIPERIYPVFRDEDSLPADADLAKSIEIALDKSKFLVVLCSPRAVESEYVAQEIEHFLQSAKEDRLITAILSGEPGDSEKECFPVPLRNLVTEDGKVREPIAADFRLRDGLEGFTSAQAYRLSLSDLPKDTARKLAEEYESRLQLMKLKIIAGVLGLPLEQLRDRDKAYQLELARKRAKRLRLWLSSLTVALVAAVVAGAVAFDQKRRAETARDAADEVINVILYDLSNELRQQGLYRIYSRVSEKAEAYFDTFPASRRGEGPNLREHAVALQNSAAAAMALGNLGLAKREAKSAVEISREVVTQKPGNEDAIYLLGSSLTGFGASCLEREEYEEAKGAFEECLDLALPLYEASPTKSHRRLLASAYQYLGEVERYVSDDLDLAISHFKQFRELAQEGIREGEMTIQDIDLHLASEAKLGTIYFQLGRFDESANHYLTRKEAAALYHEGSNTTASKYELGWSSFQLARTLWAMREYPQAEFEALQSVDIFEQLFEDEKIPRNAEPYAEVLNLLAKVHYLNRGLSASGPTTMKYLEIVQEWHRLSPTPVTKLRLAKAHQMIARATLEIPDYKTAREALINSYDIAQPLYHSRQKPEYLQVIAEAVHLTAYIDLREGDVAEALRNYEQAHVSASGLREISEGKYGTLLLATICRDWADLLLKQKKQEEAMSLFEECLEMFDLVPREEITAEIVQTIAEASYDYMRLKGEERTENIERQIELGVQTIRYFTMLNELAPSEDHNWYFWQLNKSMGTLARRLNRQEEAIAAYEETLKWLPDDAEHVQQWVAVYVELGNLKAAAGNPAVGIPYFEKAVERLENAHQEVPNPNFTLQFGIILRTMGYTHGQAEDWESAVQAFTLSLKAFENSSRKDLAAGVGFSLEEAKAMVGAESRSLDELRSDVQNEPEEVAHFLRLRQRLLSEATSQEQEEKWADVAKSLGEVLLLWGRVGQSESPLGALRGAAIPRANDIVNLSHYQILNQSFSAAEGTAQMGVNGPESATIFLNLGHALLFQGKSEEARARYQQFLESGTNEKENLKQIIREDLELFSKEGLPVESIAQGAEIVRAL